MKEKILTAGMQITLIKPYNNKLSMVGREYEIGNITNDHVVIRNKKDKVAVTAVDMDCFDEYFSVEHSRAFTDWTKISMPLTNNCVVYKTNGKKVIVKIEGFEGKSFKASASCHEQDDFNLYFGIKMAYFRAKIKENEAEINRKMDLIDRENDLLQLLSGKRAALKYYLGTMLSRLESVKG